VHAVSAWEKHWRRLDFFAQGPASPSRATPHQNGTFEQKMNASPAEGPSRSSVSRRFNLALLLLYLLSIAITSPVVYFTTERQVKAQADKELRLLVDMVSSVQGYVADYLRPYLLKRGEFYSPGFSGIVATGLIANKYEHFQPDYSIRNISDNPLNPKNGPQPLERQLLKRFRADRQLHEITEAGMLNGRRMLVSAAPKVSKKGCLRCHGDVAKAPQELREVYGDSSGYHYQVGDVVGMSLIGVPLDNVEGVAIERSLLAIGFLTLLFGVIFLAINLLVRRTLVDPILEIAQQAHAISKGQMDKPVHSERNDEVGDLAHSIELLRRSFVQAMKRMK
jgi:HAMP domain-containing protein